MPKLVGENVTVATTKAQQLGFTVESGKEENDEKVPKGSVLRTEPTAGTQVTTENSRLLLIPSAAPSGSPCRTWWASARRRPGASWPRPGSP
ncbi:PASTA domain-containing protein [Streptosporangium lutulentum]